MKATIDRAGRIVVPKALREAARLKPGSRVEIRIRGGIIEIEPAPRDVEIEQRGRFAVAVPRESGPPLAAEAVERTRAEVDEELR